MVENARSYTSLKLDGIIWTLLPVPDRSWLAMELRNDIQRKVSIIMYDYELNQIIWRQDSLPEAWWINLGWINDHTIFLKAYESTSNPDRTRWYSLDLVTGDQTENNTIAGSYTNPARYPFQFLAGESDFERIKDFISIRLKAEPKAGLEYLETGETILVSFYLANPTGYSNILSGFSMNGDILWQEEIGMNLKGIGVNTFFVVTDRIFFVKNKSELVTFRIV